MLAPQLTGIQCLESGICIDDPGRQSEAVALRDAVRRFVETRVERIRRRPRFVSCSGAGCAERFGFT